MRTANYTDLRANLKSYIDAVIDDYDTVVINRGNGKGSCRHPKRWRLSIKAKRILRTEVLYPRMKVKA